VEVYVHSLGSSAMGEVDAVWPTSCPGLFILRNCLPVPLHRRLDGPHSQLEEMEEEKNLMSVLEIYH